MAGGGDGGGDLFGDPVGGARGAAAPAGGAGLLQAMLDRVALAAVDDELLAARKPAEPPPDAVTLSTVHKAKGGEWPTVFVVRMNDGVMPLRRRGATGAEAEAEEEEYWCAAR